MVQKGGRRLERGCVTPGAVPQTRQWRVPGNVTRPRPASDQFPAVKAECILWLGSAFVGIGPLKKAGRRSGGLHTPAIRGRDPTEGPGAGLPGAAGRGGLQADLLPAQSRPTQCAAISVRKQHRQPWRESPETLKVGREALKK